MTVMQVALVAVEGAASHFDKPYAYAVPAPAAGSLLPGARVVVPFGRGNTRRRGIVTQLLRGDEFFASSSGARPIKPVLRVVDLQPLIEKPLIDLAFWLRAQTFCTLYEALRLMLPAGLDLRVTKSYARSAGLPDDAFSLLSGDERRLVALVERGPLAREKLLDMLGLAEDSTLPEDLAKRGLLTAFDEVEQRGGEATRRTAALALPAEEAEQCLSGRTLTVKQKTALRALLDAGEATVKEICYFAGVTPAVVAALEKKGIVSLFDRAVYRDPYKNLPRGAQPAPVLSPAQRRAYDELRARYRSGGASCTLLYGVTGSGKTDVYMRLMQDVRADGRGILVLVPEISLTPQAVSRFYARFGREVAVLHSGLSAGERLDEWKRVKNGEASVVVGTRSAVFAPVRNLGLIVIDEEQEHTYKSESSPRYHARDVARYRCAKGGAMLLLASATPSVESFYAAQTGRYSLTRLDERFGSAALPDVLIVDRKPELAQGIDSPLSRALLEELQKNLERGEQAILLLNRRGFHTFVYCAQCGEVLTCPHCSIALTYHAANGRLMCHTCGYTEAAKRACPACGGTFLRYTGCGTQRAEEELREALPGARILRMDTDTTTAKFSHEKILKKFAAGEYDVLVGTQMVAKGLDFERVTLVGVLSADQSLYMDDFRAAERTFSLITQVVGRAGRGRMRGRAVIQTGTPESPVLRLAARQDYDAFYKEEIALRETLLYPPFCDVCEIGFLGAEEPLVKQAAAAFFSRLRERLLGSGGLPARVMGPLPAAIAKVNNRYRYKIVVKCKNDRRFRSLVGGLLEQMGKEKNFSKVTMFADMNPLSMI